MKKFLFSLILTVLFALPFFLNPKGVAALCSPISNGSTCTRTRCAETINQISYCCDTQRECDVRSQNQSNESGQDGTITTTQPDDEVNLKCANGEGIQTAIGCIHVLGGQEQFLADILKWAVGIGGGIAFLLIVYAGFMIMTSQGNPDRLKAGQELLTSAISGLILLIFSIFALRFIGIDILGLGAFGFGTSKP